jgi:hypothetical protein
MERVHQIRQAYLQTPWRRQLQVIGGFLLVVIAVAVIAALRLSISTNTVKVGREIQLMKVNIISIYDIGYIEQPQEKVNAIESIEVLQNDIANLEAKLAYLTSSEVLNERAKELGYVPAELGSLTYVEVDGYQEREPVRLAPPPQSFMVPASLLAPEYKQSLIDWLKVNVQKQFGKLSQEVR